MVVLSSNFVLFLFGILIQNIGKLCFKTINYNKLLWHSGGYTKKNIEININIDYTTKPKAICKELGKKEKKNR